MPMPSLHDEWVAYIQACWPQETDAKYAQIREVFHAGARVVLSRIWAMRESSSDDVGQQIGRWFEETNQFMRQADGTPSNPKLRELPPLILFGPDGRPINA